MFDDSWLLDAIAALSPFDPRSVAAIIGGLQVMPENSGRLYGLQAASLAAARLPLAADLPALSAPHLQALFAEPGGILASRIENEDPLEQPFVDELVFDGGTYRFFPGLDDEAPFVLRHLLAALSVLSGDPATRAVVTPAQRLCHAALTLGNAICERADLPRGCPPAGDIEQHVVVPDDNTLAALARAVRFEAGELERMLDAAGAALSDLASLVAEQGVTFPAASWPLGGVTLGVPIVRTQDDYVVVGPHILVARLRHAIISLAVEIGFTAHLADAFRSAVLRTVSRSAYSLRCEPAKLLGPIPLAGATGAASIWGFDNDKVLHALVVTDSFTSYDRMNPLGEWHLPNVNAAIERHLAVVEELAFETQPHLSEMLHLVVIQGVGRFWQLDSTPSLLSPRSQRLTMTAADLETISGLEGGTRLRLWQFALAARQLRQTTVVRRVSLLDEFHLWRERDYGFYFGDDHRPTHVSILPGGAGSLRREVQRKHDVHGLVEPTMGDMVEVARLNSDPAVPLYSPLKGSGDRITVIADVPTGPYWVVGPSIPVSAVDRSLTAQLAEAIAYWLWQVDPGLRTSHDGHAGVSQTIVVEVTPDSSWSRAGTRERTTEALSCARIDASTIRVHFGTGAGDLFATPDNAGERYLLRQLLSVLGEPALVDGTPERRPLHQEHIDGLLETYAPLGLKKKFFLVPGGTDPRFGNRHLLPYRQVQGPDEELQLDKVGEFVRSELGYSVGLIPSNERTEVLRHVVDSRFAELKSLVETLSPDRLLETLVEPHEAVLAGQALHQLTTPTRLACFASSSDLAEELGKERTRAAQAATASRVLIEYITARPPTGDRPLSLATYDRLLAIISQLQQWAFTSDEIYYQLVDHPLEVLPSGRLGMERELYLAARNAFSSVRLLGEAGRATNEFGRYWREREDRAPLDDDEMESATAEEFGLPLGRLVDFLWAIIALGQAQSSAAKGMDKSSLFRRIAKDLSWPVTDVETAIEVFAARPRSDFRQPSPPYSLKDADPWNYTRALSYLRKPLLVREEGDSATVVWGNGNVFLAGMTLVSLCLGGRYQPRTPALRRIVGRQRQKAGEDFNDEVATYFEAIPHLVVRRRFKKAGRRRITRPNGQALGDIDVLVADRKRRRLLAVEAKNLAGARTPVEFSQDLHEVLEPRGQRSASIDKHLERVAWLQTYRAEVLQALNLPIGDAEQWMTEPLAVTNIESLAPFLVSPRIRVLSFEELRQEFGAANEE